MVAVQNERLILGHAICKKLDRNLSVTNAQWNNLFIAFEYLYTPKFYKLYLPKYFSWMTYVAFRMCSQP